MKKVWLSFGLAVFTALIGILQLKMLEGKIQNNDILGQFLGNVERFLNSYHVSSFGVYNFVDFGAEKLDSALFVNYLITYTPVYFLIFLLIHMIMYLVSVVFK